MGNSHIEFHRGETLMRLANYYPSLLLTLVEGVQNAIDAGCDRVMLCIDLQSASRQVIIVDNGDGVTKERFELALSSVGFSIKQKGSLGKFGLGLISPLNKCSSFTFTSAEADSLSALRWKFVQAEIRKQCEQLIIPCNPIPGLPVLVSKFRPYATDEFDQSWRTMVHMRGVTKDKVTSLVDLDELESQIHTKLGPAMRANKVAVRVVLFDDKGKVDQRDITPMSYTGEPLDVMNYDHEDTGRVEFELYRAPKRGGKRTGKVSIMASSDSYPITMREFASQAWGRRAADLLKDSFKVLESGYFEGVIRCQNIVLAPERTKFELSDALDTLYLVIAQWYDEVGLGHYQIEEEQSRDSRYQAIAIKSGQRLRDELLSRPEYSRLWDGLKSVVEFGRLGTGHLPPEGGKANGPEDENTIRTGQGGAGSTKPPVGGNGSSTSLGERKRPPQGPSW
jgi:hypothetical protein